MACTVPIDLTTLSLSHGVLAIFVTVLENEKTAMYMDIYTYTQYIHIHSCTTMYVYMIFELIRDLLSILGGHLLSEVIH